VAVSFEDHELEASALLDEGLVLKLVAMLTASERLFLAGLGRGFSPREAALRAGWPAPDAARMARRYLSTDPTMSRLSAHILALRALATQDGIEPPFKGTGSVQ
jgi:hypothetical protein